MWSSWGYYYKYHLKVVIDGRIHLGVKYCNERFLRYNEDMSIIFYALCSMIVLIWRNVLKWLSLFGFSYFAGAYFILLVILRICLLYTIIKITVFCHVFYSKQLQEVDLIQIDHDALRYTQNSQWRRYWWKTQCVYTGYNNYSSLIKITFAKSFLVTYNTGISNTKTYSTCTGDTFIHKNTLN